MTSLDLDTLIDRAAVLGASDGRSAASWRTAMDADEARRCLDLSDDGDPEWWDTWGYGDGPLSGVWADQRTPDSLLEDLDVPEDERDGEYGDVFDAFEVACQDAYVHEIESAALVHVAFDVYSRMVDGEDVSDQDVQRARAYLSSPDAIRIPGSLATSLEDLGVKPFGDE